MIEGTLTSEVGKFFIGDICYALESEIYHNYWGNKCHFEDGCYEINNSKFAVASTAFGDGIYSDNEGSAYPVDAGNIGIVPMELWKKGINIEQELERLGKIVETNSIDFKATGRQMDESAGCFEIKFSDSIITINTNEELEEDLYI